MSEAGTATPTAGRRVGRLALRGGGALVRLVLVLACFTLAAYTVNLLLLRDESVYLVAFWFAGALFLHDLVLFPLYAGGDRILSLVLRILPRTPVPLVNHVRIPVLGAGLSLIMFLPGIIREGGATHLAASGLTQEPYRDNWVHLAIGLFAASAAIWILRMLVVLLVRGVRWLWQRRSPGHGQQVVDGEREDGLGDEPAADLTAGQHPAGEHQPDAER